MDVRTGGPILHGIFCSLAGILFIAFFLSVAAGPAWWNSPSEYRVDSWLGPVLVVAGIAIIFQIILGIWVGLDAHRRGMNGYLWGALTCFTCVVGLIVYMLSAQTPQESPSTTSPGEAAPRSACPGCGGAVRPDFLACPYCGTQIGRTCVECGKVLDPGWAFCPNCSTRIDGAPVTG